MARTGPLSVVVSALTRRRPAMASDLVASFGAATLPDDVTVTFLIVENDTEERTRDTVEAARPLANGAELAYVLEPEPGIPFGRNRAAKEAIARGADLLAFVDDDEVIAQDWLVRIIDGYRNSEAVLLGAPLRAGPPTGDETWIQTVMHRNVEVRYRRKEDRAARKADLNGTLGVTIVTNNWLGEVTLFTEHDLWFDEEMRYTGGTDSKFHAELRAKGLPSGWVADAFVYETVPPERLSFWYQLNRAKSQSNVYFTRKMEANPAIRYRSVISIPVKMVSALGLAIALPFTRGGTLLDLARTLGWIAGRIGAIVGTRSRLYEKTTGS